MPLCVMLTMGEVYSEAIWAFDELIQMLRDGVVDWVESAPS